MFFIGCLAFAIFFFSDYNDATLHRRGFMFCFPLGAGLLIFATIAQLRFDAVSDVPLLLRFFFLTIFTFSAVLLIYTLFFAISPAAAYGAPGKKRAVCTDGVYALCRHPGVLWFALAYICLLLAGGLPPYVVITYIFLNVALVAFEDEFVFPIVLSGYEAYQNKTPFLIPNPESIKTAFGKKRTESVTGR
jgi:protein-S-isoprenylcysteine O-methyltransferase Ste14